MPNIRALLKMHKVKVAARLIVANTAWATTPAAIFVATFLQAIVASFQHVASATDDAVQLVRDYVPDNGDVMHTFDVDNMYPSLDQSTVVSSVRTVLVAHYNEKHEPKWGARVEAKSSYYSFSLF